MITDIIIIILLLLILIVLLCQNINNTNTIEGFTTENLEAINNLASMYENGDLKVSNLDVSGKANINDLTLTNPKINGNLTLTNSKNESVSLEAVGNGVISIPHAEFTSAIIDNLELKTLKGINKEIGGYDPIYMEGDNFAFVLGEGSNIRGIGYK